MRIVLDLQACQASSMNRGIGRYSLSLALAMARHIGRHDLRIVVNGGFQDSAIALRKTLGTVVPPSAIDTFATPLPTAEGNPDNHWRLHAAERIREHYLASLRPDVVHITSLFEGFGDNSVNSVLHGDGKFDTAVTLYDLIPLLRKERYLDDPNIAAWYYRKLESLKNASLLLAISAHARDEAIGALDLAPAQVVNISSAADPIFAPRIMASETRAALLARHGLPRPFIMYTGGIDYRKNIEGLIAAYAALPGNLRSQYQLAVVCSIHAPDRVRLQRLARRLGLSGDDLVLTGFVSDDDLVGLYNCTALFVFPSLHEGFGLPVLEAMACGAPVIGSNTSSIPEVLGRADATFDPLSVPDITATMARVLGDPAYGQALRAHGLAQARLFSWDASAKRAIAAFEESHQRKAAVRNTAIAPGAAPAARRQKLALVAAHGRASAGLLGALAPCYDADLLPEAHCTPAWFDAHAHEYERIVYHFGDWSGTELLHTLLALHPGVVVIDTPVADTAALSSDAGHWRRAVGVIVHAEASMALARAQYGAVATEDWHVVPASGAAAAAGLRDAIEASFRDGQTARELCLVQALATLAPGRSNPAGSDYLQVAAAIAANRPRSGARQLLFDVTALAMADPADPLVQRQRELAAALVRMSPHWRTEPIRHDGKRYRYARHFKNALPGCAGPAPEDTAVDVGAGDVLLGAAGTGSEAPIFPSSWQARGVVLQQWDVPADGSLDCAGLAAALLARLPVDGNGL
jgi:glycosyltransferase involved in cell wall biosynthesis